MSDGGDKTEEATPQRLRKAREQGDSGASAFGAQAVAFAAAVLLVPAAIQALAVHTAADLRRAIARAALAKFAGGPAMGADLVPATALATEWLALVAPLLGAVALVGALAHVVQTGGSFTLHRLTPKFERLNPVEGLKGLVSAARAFAVARALFAGGLSGWLAYEGLRAHVLDIAHLTGRPRWVGTLIAAVAGGLAWRIAFVGLLLGVLDVVVTRGAWRRRLRMSKEEVRREHRDSEGDPQLKAARERAHHEMLAEATIANVKKATVVVVNPTHLACALRYDDAGGDAAPVVIAHGEGDFALRIVRAARDHHVPVLQNVPLARTLAELRVGDVIPEALYEAVAEILGEVARSKT